MIILMNGELLFNHSDIEQMAGRGNRSQGVSKAHVFLCSLAKHDSIEAILQQNDGKVLTDAAVWMQNLFARYDELPQHQKPGKLRNKFRNRVVEALENLRWLTHHDEIDQDVRDWLEGAEYNQ